MKPNKIFIKGSIFAVFSFLNSGINFILLTILAYYLNVEDFGLLNLYTIYFTVISTFISLNTNSYLQVGYFRSNIEHFNKILSSVYIVTLLSLFALFLIIVCVNCLFVNFDKYVGINFHFQLFALLNSFTNSFYLVCLEIWRIKENIRNYVFFSFLFVVFNAFLSIILVTEFAMAWAGRVYAQLLVSGVFFLFALYHLYKMGHLSIKIDKKVFSETLSYSLPLLPHNSSSWIRQGLDRYILNYYGSLYEVGLFSFAFSVANVIHMVGASFNSSNSVFIFKELSSDNVQRFDNIKKITKTYLIFYSLLTLLGICLLCIFINFIFVKYASSVKYLIPLMISSLLQCIYYLYVNILFYYKKTRRLMLITFSFSILHVLLAFLLVPMSSLYLSFIYVFVNVMITFAVYLTAKKIIEYHAK